MPSKPWGKFLQIVGQFDEPNQTSAETDEDIFHWKTKRSQSRLKLPHRK
jgi:hypothetical protein